MLHPATTLNCRGKLLELRPPRIMGILNLTPDSFFDGGKYQQEEEMLRQASRMINEGADMLDLGGMSSRPGAELVSVQEEMDRVLPALTRLQREFPETIYSVDTVRAEVARAAVAAGAGMINDISAGRFDPDLYSTVGQLGVPYVLMHMQGTPATMQKTPTYTSVVEEVLQFFLLEMEKLRLAGVKDILLDVGFGFGKSVAHNFELLAALSIFKIPDLPILVGLSRKSMICKVLGVNPDKALNGTTALHMTALQQGASLLRVHDVKEARETILLYEQLQATNWVQSS